MIPAPRAVEKAGIERQASLHRAISKYLGIITQSAVTMGWSDGLARSGLLALSDSVVSEVALAASIIRLERRTFESVRLRRMVATGRSLVR